MAHKQKKMTGCLLSLRACDRCCEHLGGCHPKADRHTLIRAGREAPAAPVGRDMPTRFNKYFCCKQPALLNWDEIQVVVFLFLAAIVGFNKILIKINLNLNEATHCRLHRGVVDAAALTHRRDANVRRAEMAGAPGLLCKHVPLICPHGALKRHEPTL